MTRISNSIPIQFWEVGETTNNEMDIVGVQKHCYCQPIQCADTQKIVRVDTVSRDYRVNIFDADGNSLAQLPMTEIIDGSLYVYYLDFANFSAYCNQKISMNVGYYVDDSTTTTSTTTTSGTTTAPPTTTTTTSTTTTFESGNYYAIDIYNCDTCEFVGSGYVFTGVGTLTTGKFYALGELGFVGEVTGSTSPTAPTNTISGPAQDSCAEVICPE